MTKEILWILILGSAVLAIFVSILVLDAIEAVREQRRAHKAYKEWLWRMQIYRQYGPRTDVQKGPAAS